MEHSQARVKNYNTHQPDICLQSLKQPAVISSSTTVKLTNYKPIFFFLLFGGGSNSLLD